MPRTRCADLGERLARLLLALEDELLRRRPDRCRSARSARPRSIVSITSRCWAPSWRSRSIRWSSLASTSMTADRLCRSVSTWRRSSRLSDVHSSRRRPPMEGHDELRQGRRDRQQDEPGDRAEPTPRRRPGERVVPDRRSSAAARAAVQTSATDDELDDGQRQVDRDVEHVPPAALVGELGPQDVEEAAAQRPIRVRGRRAGLADEHPPALDPGDEPRALDRRARGRRTPIPARRIVRPAEASATIDRERDEPDEQAQDDRAVRVPGRRMDRRQQERPERGTVDPRPSERRSAGDPG